MQTGSEDAMSADTLALCNISASDASVSSFLITLNRSACIQPTQSTVNITSLHANLSSSLSAGNAAFILVALFLGCLSQPSGFLLYPGCSRLWRLSPFFSAIESMLICTHLITALVHRKSVRVKALALLARRLGASREYQIQYKTQRGIPAPTIKQMKALLHEAQNLERGLTLRLAIALPMTLQFLKIGFIRGIPLTTTIGIMYFSNWLAVETLILMVDGKVFSEDEQEEALEELIKSIPPTRVVSDEPSGEQVCATQLSSVNDDQRYCAVHSSSLSRQQPPCAGHAHRRQTHETHAVAACALRL
jgi:hypothetical protein